MKKILSILRDYYREHFNWLSFVLCALLGAGMILVAYHNGFYETHIEHVPDTQLQIIRYCELYTLAFVGAFLLQGFAEKDLSFLKSGNWWLLCFLAIFLFAVRGSDIDFGSIMFGTVHPDTYVFYNKAGYNLAGFFTLIIPCFIYWFFADRGKQNFYGFKIKGVSLYPYFIMLAIMVPLLCWAGTQADFLDTYPRYTKIGMSAGDEHYKLYVLAYELVYGSDFFFTEFFFRGFVILAFARRFGHRAILPMCVYYITIHFGKPMGETISSFFGGLLLGVIAFRSKSIYGGIIVHLGIAYLMEIFAFLGRSGYLHF
ncbi:MAG TPA: CPBP family glutamic-type intramembrane protease [Chitinophagaceae bacterium]|nr:CPBP family glutamic-type intramembrane protease [Chitinophagaceae bacterium]